ncbi:glycoside hydrolase family 35 protein [Aspergillus affinis]|uniref:glycoside hydrolase family 35 protein n=1 Tax=Aspergillus affinis TaxID=1070780 RepID=UPI0022FF3161|nr:putative beta-galactosidase B [Aspergillus affinis]KAI9044003.1 putative beta-galactosidase B [Aspergillus affinis]
MTRIMHLAVLLLSSIGLLAAAQNQSDSDWPLHDNGLNTAVQWDHYSFHVHGQRIFIFSGEFHYWRIPVPELWRDILEKVKATGFTAFAFYSSWAYHAPNNHTVDFHTGARDITPIFELAKELGMYMIVRPGPYVNAEASAGGFPLWATTGAYGSMRNDDPRYTAAWKPYFEKMSQITSKYQLTDGQNTFCYQIENEYGQQWIGDPSDRNPNKTAVAYMELLEKSARENGIVVPLTANDPNLNTKSWGNDWSNAGGNVDAPGVDSYPSCWTCDVSQCTSTNGEYVPYKVIPYYDYFQEVQPSMPAFMPEFQGGSYNPWAGPEGGCPEDTGADFANLFYRWNIAQRVTAMSLYMVFGGTNWGSLAAPVTATSYDYSSPIAEDRSIGDKYHETKLLSLFTRSAKDLTMTDLIGNGTKYTDNAAVSAYELRNPETNGAFYVTIHKDTTIGSDESFKLHVNTSAGALTIPSEQGKIRLNGHQSKIIVTDFAFGSKTLLYSTAEVLTYAVIDDHPTLVLWVPTGESGEFAIKGTKSGKVASCNGCSSVKFNGKKDHVVVGFTQAKGMSVLQLDDDVRVVVLDRSSAYHFWAPTLTDDPIAPEDELVLVEGPYLVRAASVSGSTLALRGDSTDKTNLEVFAPKDVKAITWNGKQVKSSETPYGSLKATLAAPPSIKLPSFGSWRSNDSLPERLESYDDSGPAWVDANHETTLNPHPPVTSPVLYANEYGFHNGVRLWRGYFNGTASGVFLNIQGGAAFGWSAYLNGHFLGSYLGNATIEQANKTLTFANNTLHTRSGSRNTLLVIHDDTGHDMTTGVLNPRGIIEARLLGSSAPNFTHWRLAGTAGGESNLDPVRGVYNEDGLHAERVGWHLPGFDDSAWSVDKSTNHSSSSVSKLSFSGATVRFFRTTVPLNIPSGLDVSISFILGTPAGTSKAYRAQLFVNGYQYGRYHPHIGNQVVYPVPAGILDYRGENTIGLAVWAQSEDGAAITVDWRVNYVADSSLDVANIDEEKLRPGWEKEREKFA